MENSQEFIEILQEISLNLRHFPFWQDYAFWTGLASILVLLWTLHWLKKYTKATEGMRVEMIRQTNLQQMPIIILYIRDIQDYMDNKADYDEQQKIRRKREDFLIRIRTESSKSNYFLALRNVGNGTAFNIEVKSNLFEVVGYQSRFIAPKGDEQAFSICQKGNKKIESWDTFNQSEFTVRCKDVSGAIHTYHYRVIDLREKKIKFIKKTLVQ